MESKKDHAKHQWDMIKAHIEDLKRDKAAKQAVLEVLQKWLDKGK